MRGLGLSGRKLERGSNWRKIGNRKKTRMYHFDLKFGAGWKKEVVRSW